MYHDTITIFNRKKGRDGDTWYPTILSGVNLNKDKGEVIARYGPNSSDNAILNVRYENDGEDMIIGGKQWMQPKLWQKSETPANYLTFAAGDFFWNGTWDGGDVLYDGTYGDQTFYDYMLANYDDVFMVTSVGWFSVIPHVEVVGK